MKIKIGEINKIKFNGRKLSIYILKDGDKTIPGKTRTTNYSCKEIFKKNNKYFIKCLNDSHIYPGTIIIKESFQKIYFEIVEFYESKNYESKRQIMSF